MKAKSKTKVIAVFVIGILLIASIFFSGYFFIQKQKAEKYQTLVEQGAIEQGEDVNLNNYDDEGNLKTENLTSSGGVGRGSGGGGAVLPTGTTPPVEVSEEAGLTFYGVWTTESSQGIVGGQNEINSR